MKKFELSEVISELKKISNDKLNAQEDLERIISTSIQFNQIKELEAVSFQAKYIHGLIRVIQKRETIVDESYSIKIKEELVNGYENLKNGLKKITQNCTPFIQQVFEEKYFQLTQSSLKNLNLLSEDLSILKLYFNDLKTKEDSI
jgi:hypothetical protein